MPINYINTDLCKQFIANLNALEEKVPDRAIVTGLKEFAALSWAGAYGDADKKLALLREGVTQIDGGSELLKQAEKIQKAAGSLLGHYRDTKNSGERWLATYLNDLNRAALLRDRDGQKTAIQNIWHIQKQLKPGQAAVYQELCEERIKEVDGDGSMRHELTTWPGYLKSGAISTAKPVVSVAVAFGTMWGINKCVIQPIRSGIVLAVGNEVAQAAFLNLTAMGAYRSAKTFVQQPCAKTLIATALSAYAIYHQVTALCKQMNAIEG